MKYKENQGSYYSHCRCCETLYIEILLRGHTDSPKNDAEVGMGIETLTNIFKKPHECLMFYCFSLDLFCGISRQTVISYGFLCFTSWLVYVK